MKPNTLILTPLLVLGLGWAYVRGHTVELCTDMSRSSGMIPVVKAPVPPSPAATSTSGSTADPRVAIRIAFGGGGAAGWQVSRDPGTRHCPVLGHLRCEYRENPLGIDALRPRLSGPFHK